MASEWTRYIVSDIGKIVTGKTPKTSNPDFYGGSIPFLTPSDNMSVKYVLSTSKTITELGKLSVKNSVIPADSVCVSCIGSDLGKVVITTEETVTNQQINSIVIDKSRFDVDFVYYSMIVLGRLLNYHSKTSTAVPIVNKSTFSQYEIFCPSLGKQKQIASILSEIDNKIALNTAINENLEQQAQAIFKSWFVDFEPFGGIMPDDWKTGTIADLGTVVGGGTPSKKVEEYYTTNGIAWITPKDLSNDKSKFIAHGQTDISDLGLAKSSATLMPKGTVLFSSRAPIGYIAIANDQVSTNQGFKSVVPFENIGTAYVYYFLKNNLSAIENVASGSTFKEVSGSTMKNFGAVIPDNDTLAKFQQFCTPLFEQQCALECENCYLSALRDTLLPKMMSGEIDVSDV